MVGGGAATGEVDAGGGVGGSGGVQGRGVEASGGTQPTTVRWVDVDRGEAGYRSRLVARDFKPKGERYRFDLFVAPHRSKL